MQKVFRKHSRTQQTQTHTIHTPCHKQRVLWEEVWGRESTSSRQQQQQRCKEWQLLTEDDMRDHLCTKTPKLLHEHCTEEEPGGHTWPTKCWGTHRLKTQHHRQMWAGMQGSLLIQPFVYWKVSHCRQLHENKLRNTTGDTCLHICAVKLHTWVIPVCYAAYVTSLRYICMSVCDMLVLTYVNIIVCVGGAALASIFKSQHKKKKCGDYRWLVSTTTGAGFKSSPWQWAGSGAPEARWCQWKPSGPTEEQL